MVVAVMPAVVIAAATVTAAAAMAVVMSAWALGLRSLLRSMGWAIIPIHIIPTLPPTPIPTLLTVIRGQRWHLMAGTWSRAFLRRPHHRHRHRHRHSLKAVSYTPLRAHET